MKEIQKHKYRKHIRIRRGVISDGSSGVVVQTLNACTTNNCKNENEIESGLKIDHTSV